MAPADGENALARGLTRPRYFPAACVSRSIAWYGHFEARRMLWEAGGGG
jgi:hypothetical protein